MRLSTSRGKDEEKTATTRSSYMGNRSQGYGRRVSCGSTGSMPSSQTRRKTLTAGNKLSDSANLERLRHLESVFRSADANGSGELDMAEFVAAFEGVISTPEGSDEEALQKLFMRIDANCDGTVDWNEFSAYLLLEKTNGSGAAGAAAAAASAGSYDAMTYSSVEPPTMPPGAAHRELISGLMHVDTGNGPDRWYSAGKDGTVCIWNGKDLTHMRTLQTPLQSITAASYLPNSDLLALGSYTSCVLLVDPASGEQAGKLPAAASSATLSLAGWQEDGGIARLGGGRELLGIGDADGCVSLMEVLVDEVADKKSNNRYVGKQLWRTSNHHDWVVGVTPLPQLSALIAASLDKTLTMTDLERRIAVKTLSGHEKSVTCCAWSGVYKMAISGGQDRQIILWNPFSCRPLGSLAGHVAPLVAVTVNERAHQVISAAADKTIKVWDLRNQRCLQTFQDRTAYSPEDTISAVTYSSSRKLLVSGAYSLKPWQLCDGKGNAECGHKAAVSWVRYNPMFNETVSTDHAGTVCVWHVPTGKLRSSFGNTHGGCRISAATFDTNHRRLITGADDGSVKVWNFSSGALLSTLATPDNSHGWGTGAGAEVTGVAASNSNNARNITVTGWDRKVTWYDDNGRRKCGMLRSSAGPTSDVLAAALMQGYPTLATACYNGEIWLWNLESGAARCKLLPVGHARQPENEQPVERLAFMHGQLRHVLVAVGADRMLRFWDCFSGTCLLEHFTGHQLGESVAALALSPDNTTAVTADTAGYIMVWDLSSLWFASSSKACAAQNIAAVTRPSSAAAAAVAAAALDATLPGTAAHNSIRRLAVWRAHSDAVTALDWIPAPTPAAVHAAAESLRSSDANAAAGPNALTGLVGGDGGDSARGSRSTKCQSGYATRQQQEEILQHQQQQTAPRQQQHWRRSHVGSIDSTISAQQQQQHQQLSGPPEQPADEQTARNLGYIVSAALDNSLLCWCSSGALLGAFGKHNWVMERVDTWQRKTRVLLKAGEGFDMLVSVNPLSSPADTTKHVSQEQQRKQHPSLQQLHAPKAAAAAASECANSGSSRPPSATLSQPGGFKTAPRTGAAVAPGTPLSRLLSDTPCSRHLSGVGAQQSVLQQSSVGSTGQRLTSSSRPESASVHGGSIQQQVGQFAASEENAAAARQQAGQEASSEGATTQQSIMLVCQTSMRMREHSLRTLHSLKQHESRSNVQPAVDWAGLEGLESTAAFIAEDENNSSDDEQLSPAAAATAGSLQPQPFQAQGSAATTATTAAACAAPDTQQRPSSAFSSGRGRSRSSRVGFAGLDHGQGDAQDIAWSGQASSRDHHQQQMVTACDVATAAAGQQGHPRGSAVEAGIQQAADFNMQHVPLSSGDSEYESRSGVAEDDLPSSLWLPQFGHKPAAIGAAAAAKHVFKPGQLKNSARQAKLGSCAVAGQQG